MTLQHLVKNKFIGNTSWIMASQIFYMIIGFLVSIFAARFFGPEDYGVFNYSASIIALYTSLATLGFDSILIKELVNRREENGLILGTGIVFRIASSLFVCLISAVTVWILKPENHLIFMITVIQSISFIFKSFDLIELWFQSNLESKYVSKAKIISTTVIMVMKFIAIFYVKSLTLFAWCVVFDALLMAVFYMILYYRNSDCQLKVSLHEGKKLLLISCSFIISTFFITVYSKIDQIMIGNLMSEASVGFYSVAVFFETAWYFIPTAIITSAKPLIFDSGHDNIVRNRRVKQLYAAVFWLGVFVAVMFTLFSKYAIVLMYGVEYQASVAPTNIIIWAGAFAMLGSVRAIWLLCENKQKYTIFFVVLGAVLNIILNFILIPIIGISGAAAATLATQIFQVMICPFLFHQTRECTRLMIQGILLRF